MLKLSKLSAISAQFWQSNSFCCWLHRCHLHSWVLVMYHLQEMGIYLCLTPSRTQNLGFRFTTIKVEVPCARAGPLCHLSTASLPWGDGATRNFGAALDGDPLQLKRTTWGRFVRWVSVLWVMVWGEMSVPQAGHMKDVASSDCIHFMLFLQNHKILLHLQRFGDTYHLVQLNCNTVTWHFVGMAVQPACGFTANSSTHSKFKLQVLCGLKLFIKAVFS